LSKTAIIGGLTKAIPFFIHYLRQPRLELYLEADEKKTYYHRTVAGTTYLGQWMAIWAKNTPDVENRQL